MADAEANIAKIEKLLSLMDGESFTKSDFLKSLETVVNYVKRIENQTVQALTSIADKLNAFQKQLADETKNAQEDLKMKTNMLFVQDRLKAMEADMRVMITKRMDGAMMKTDAEDDMAMMQKMAMDYCMKEMKKMMAVMDKKMASVRDGSPDSPEEVVAKLNRAKTKIKHLQIDGLERQLKTSHEQVVSMASQAGRDIFTEIDISSQLDGVTKTFNIQAVYKILTVDLSSFPNALRKTTDFTYTPTSITFTSAIDAATQLAAGQTCIITAVSA